MEKNPRLAAIVKVAEVSQILGLVVNKSKTEAVIFSKKGFVSKQLGKPSFDEGSFI